MIKKTKGIFVKLYFLKKQFSGSLLKQAIDYLSPSMLQVSKERGEQLAIEYGIKFMETSAKASINVEDAFFTLARDIKVNMEKRLEAQNPPRPSGGFQPGRDEGRGKNMMNWLSRCSIL